MKTRTILIALGVAMVLGGAAVSWRAMNARRGAEAATLAARRSVRVVEKAVQALETRKVALSSPSGDREGPAVAIVRAGEPAPFPAAKLSAMSASKNEAPPNPLDPAQQALAVQRYKASLPLSYYALYRAAGWSPALIAEFEDILATHEGRDSDVRATSSERELGLADPAIVQLRSEEEARFKAELRDQLGESVLRQFEAYMAGANERRVVGQIVGALALSPAPMTKSQAQQLADLVRASGVAGPHQTDRAAWDGVAARASAFLEPAQLEELRARTPVGNEEELAKEIARAIEADRQAKAAKNMAGGG